MSLKRKIGKIMVYSEINFSDSCVNVVEKYKRIIDFFIKRGKFGKVNSLNLMHLKFLKHKRYILYFLVRFQ